MPDLAELNIRVNSQEAKEAEKHLTKLGESAEKAEEKTGELKEGMGKLGEMLTHIIELIAGAAAIGGTLGLALEAIKKSGEFEDLVSAFESLTHSAEDTKEVMEELENLRTPFDSEALLAAGRQMLTFGFAVHEVVPDLKNISDAMAAMGRGQQDIMGVVDAMGRMQQTGKVTTREMLTFAGAGVQAWKYLSESIGRSVIETQDLVGKGAISGRAVINAIMSGMRQDFAGEAEKNTHTLLGAWRDLKNQLSPVVRQIGDALVEALDLHGLISRVTQFVMQYREQVVDTIRVTLGLKPVFEGTAEAAEKFAKAIQAVAAAAATILVLNSSVATFSLLAKVVALVGSSTVIVVAAIAALVGAFVYLRNTTAEATDTFTVWIRRLAMVGTILGPFIMLQDVLSAMGIKGVTLVELFVNIGRVIAEGGSILLRFLGFLARLYDVLTFGPQVRQMLMGIMDGFNQLLEFVRGKFLDTFGSTFDALADLWRETFGHLFSGEYSLSDIVQGSIDYAEEGFKAVMSVLEDLLTGMTETAKETFTVISDIFSIFGGTLFTLFTGIGGNWNGLFTLLWNTAKTAVNGVIGLFVALGHTVQEVGKGMMAVFIGILDTIKYTTQAVIDAGNKNYVSAAANAAAAAAAADKVVKTPQNTMKDLASKWADDFSTDYVGELTTSLNSGLTNMLKDLKAPFQLAFDDFMTKIDARKAARELAEKLAETEKSMMERRQVELENVARIEARNRELDRHNQPRDFGSDPIIANLLERVKALNMETKAITENSGALSQQLALMKMQEEDKMATPIGDDGKPDYELMMARRRQLQELLIATQTNAQAKVRSGTMDQIQDLQMQTQYVGNLNNAYEEQAAALKLVRQGMSETDPVIKQLTDAMHGLFTATRADDLRKQNDELTFQFSLLGKSADEQEQLNALHQLELKGWHANDAAVVEYLAHLRELQQARQLEQLARNIGDAFGSAFEDAVMGAKSLSDALKALAQDIERMILHQFATVPLSNALTGGLNSLFGALMPGAGGGGGTSLQPLSGTSTSFPSLATLHAGGVMDRGVITPFATGAAFAGGDVVNHPTYFAMAQGKTGLMGEAGPEAIMPLYRAPSGQLGVKVSDHSGTIIPVQRDASGRLGLQPIASDMTAAMVTKAAKVLLAGSALNAGSSEMMSTITAIAAKGTGEPAGETGSTTSRIIKGIAAGGMTELPNVTTTGPINAVKAFAAGGVFGPTGEMNVTTTRTIQAFANGGVFGAAGEMATTAAQTVRAFANGGTVGMPGEVDLPTPNFFPTASGAGETVTQGSVVNHHQEKHIIVNMNVNTPNADSFRKSKNQLAMEMRRAVSG